MKFYRLIAIGTMLITSVAVQADRQTFITKLNELLKPLESLAKKSPNEVLSENGLMMFRLHQTALGLDTSLKNIMSRAELYNFIYAQNILLLLKELKSLSGLIIKTPDDQNRYLQQIEELESLLRQDF